MSSYAVVNPATGDKVKEYPEITDAELQDTIGKVDDAYWNWSQNSSLADRAAMIRKVGELHVERREALAEIIVREMGKPVEQALGEVDFAADIYA
jgi:succinate-semialdehyde dehydrogenase/glutarate-semialdehyde dehydrogenase